MQTQFNETQHFKWIELKKQVNWRDVEATLDYAIKMKNLGETKNSSLENDLFDEVSYLKAYVTDTKILDWANSEVEVDQKWIEIFDHFSNNHVPCEYLKKMSNCVCAYQAQMQQRSGFFQSLTICGLLRSHSCNLIH